MWLVVTDLDGTLLNQTDYAWQPAAPALSRLQEEQIPVVFCTSKTRAETELLRRATGNRAPFITENGGAVFYPDAEFGVALSHLPLEDGYRVDALGEPYCVLVEALGEAARQAHCTVQGFASATNAEVAAWCDFSEQEAELARQREFDEPFLLKAGNPAALTEAIEKLGFRWTRGGRFWHMLGENDKGAALQRLRDSYALALEPVRIIALGDSPNDLPFLERADIPILMPSPRLEEMRSALPRARVAPDPGARGWNEAILSLLSHDEQPH